MNKISRPQPHGGKMKKHSGKKRNKVDPILNLARKNREQSLMQQLHNNNVVTIRKNRHDDEQESKKELHAELEAQRLFNEMKRRDF